MHPKPVPTTQDQKANNKIFLLNFNILLLLFESQSFTNTLICSYFILNVRGKREGAWVAQTKNKKKKQNKNKKKLSQKTQK
ncbi:MAG: hypothetical protein IPF58_09325 [Saprospirales bacterium]|nr:hypothetical protein [Saprospirales bacterium]